MPQMTMAILDELKYYGNKSSKRFFNNEIIQTIYFGGGTPSVLSVEDLKGILEVISHNYEVDKDAEITIEANPEDLGEEYCRELKEAGINRLSIGIQSFYDEHLLWMNRSHNADQATDCIKNAVNAGITNISIDLIYGFPGLTNEQWQNNLKLANDLPINHLSSYCLTVEESTPLKKLIETGRYSGPDEDTAGGHFQYLMDWSKNNTWEHYEISNLCRNAAYSKHNTGYWNQKRYLGIGPSAHSYNWEQRRWNIKDNKQYVMGIEKKVPQIEIENLTTEEKLNELVLTSLRTQWGLDLTKASELLGVNYYTQKKKVIEKYISQNLLHKEGNIITLTDRGKFFADGIASDLFALQATANQV